MKNPASAREEEKDSKIISHGEVSLRDCSLWLIIFIGILFFVSAFFGEGLGFRQNPDFLHHQLNPQPEVLFTYQEVKRYTLDNGLIVLLKENHNLPLVSIFLTVKSGSAQEGKFSGSGIAHFVEHMVFKGTEKRKVGAIFKEIESYGGTINGFTGYDYTGYTIVVPSEFVFPALEVLADIVMNATFKLSELEKEKEVVLKEIRLNYDSPSRYASRLLWQTAFSDHPYKYPILGEEDLFNRLTRNDLLEFYQTRYTSNNMVLAIVGDMEEEKTLAFTKNLLADFSRKSTLNFSSEPEPAQSGSRQDEEDFTSGLTYLLLGFHSVALTDEDCFALDVLATILGEGESSRLYKLICAKGALAYNLEAINYTPKQPGLFIISGLLEERHRERVLSLIFKQLALVKKKKVSEKELEEAKNKIVSDLLFQNQTIEAQAQDLAFNEATTGDFRFTEKYIQGIKEVTADDILQVANKYLQENSLSLVALTPREKTKKLDSSISPRERLTMGIENLNQEEQTLSIKKAVLDNGLTILVRENKELPLVSIKVAFQGGLRAETEQTNGLCNLVAQMLDKGTKAKTASAITYLVESKGAHLSCFSGNNSFGLSLDLLSKDFDSMFSLLADLIINAQFPKNEFKREKEKSLARLKTLEDDIFESGNKLLQETLFQEYPYRLLVVGNEASLKKLTRRDLINFHQKFCVGRNTVMAIFGDIDSDDVLEKAKRFFSGLNPGNAPQISPQKEPQIKSVRTATKVLPKKQSLVLFGFYGTCVSHQDRYVLELICQLLSQPSGKLFTQIRERIGLAYTLGAYQVLGPETGYLIIYVATTGENVQTVKEEIFRALRLLKEEPLGEEELEQAKWALVSKKMISRQTNSACGWESSLDELYGLGFDHYLRYTEQIKSIRNKDITRCAKFYFDFDNYALVTMGPENYSPSPY